tara:strand:- start:6424 stop:6828 length:405 start_codon:yes stop_codon:yes gene_type:complete
MNKLKKLWENNKLFRFLIIGSLTVIIDFILYSILYLIGFSSLISKSLGFISGTIFAYFANRSLTFKSNKKGLFIFINFLLLYILSLFMNVVINEAMLDFYLFGKLNYLISFIVATGFSATLNFMVMNFILFKKK